MKNKGNPNHDKETGQFTSKNSGSAEGKSQKQRKLSLHLEKLRNEATNRLENEKPIAEIKGDEFEGKTLKEKREKAREYFENNLRNKEFENKSLNKKIKILSGDKTFGQASYEDKINSVKYLPQILKNSHHIDSAKEMKGRRSIEEWHYLAAKIKVPNGKHKKERMVLLTIKQDRNGNYYYSHHLNDFQK